MKGKKDSKKKSDNAVQYPHNLGFSTINSINAKVSDALAEFDREIEWLHELLFECKKAFAKPDIQLLPKTPTAKKRGRQKRPATCSDSEDVFKEPPSKRQSINAGEDADVDDGSSTPPAKSYRTRAASRTVTNSTRPKRTTRTNKTSKTKTEEPVLSMTKKVTYEIQDSSQETSNSVEMKSEEPSEFVNNTPIAKETNVIATVLLETPTAEHVVEENTPKAVDNNGVVKEDLVVQETPDMCTASPVTPTTVVKSKHSDENTPVNTENKQFVEESSPESEIETLKNSRASIRRSLKHGKTLNSSVRLSSFKRMSLVAVQAIEAEAIRSLSNDTKDQIKVPSPEEKPVRARTRLRLKKTSQNTDSVSSDKSVASVSSQGSTGDQDTFQEDDKPERSTRTKSRKPNSESVPKSRTKTRNKHQSGQESVENDSEDEVMLISDSEESRPETNQRLNASNNDDDIVFSTENKPVRASTRTKQKNSKSSVRTESENEDSGILSSMSEMNIPRTRSKMRPNKTSANSSSSDNEDHFVKPENPPPRTRTKTKKRPLSDEDADMSISKKNCMDQSNASDTSVGLPISNSTFMSGKQDETKVSTDEECTSSSDYDSPVCPRDKIVRPRPDISTFVHNLNNKIAVSNKPGIIKSFIKRNSPARKLTPKQSQDQKKKELVEKERKEQERLHRRQVEMQQRIEEQRRKNDEKMKKAAEMREQKAKRDQEMRDKVMKKLEEKRQLNEKQKEEKAKEEQEKHQLRLKKLQEAEDRRKREEDERLQKIQIQEEEQKMLQEVMLRKKEFDEQERLKKIAEDKKKYEERMAALEKDRQDEIEMLKKREEEKAREQQRIREERERTMALEKAEREKQALEQKKQKDLLLKERMERIKELEKKRLLEEEKRRAELREREEAVKQIINNHNSNIMNTKEEILKAAMSSLNTTQTYTSSAPYNADSYDMTPAKTYKPSTFETYDISGLKSDDSTDDEDAPKKRIPPWASGPNLKAALINQHYHPPNLEEMFDEIIPPDLNELFIKKKARFNKRTSSAHWDSPILRPGSVVLNW